MKITMNFDLPEEKDELQLALHGISYYCALWDLDQALGNLYRGRTKMPEKLQTPLSTIDYVRDLLRKKMEENSVSLEDVS